MYNDYEQELKNKKSFFLKHLKGVEKEYPNNKDVKALIEKYLKRLEGVKTLNEVNRLWSEFLEEIKAVEEQIRLARRGEAHLRYQMSLFYSDLTYTISFSNNNELRRLASRYKEALDNLKTLRDFPSLQDEYQEEKEKILVQYEYMNLTVKKNELIREIDALLEEAESSNLNQEIISRIKFIRHRLIMVKTLSEFKALEQDYLELKYYLEREKENNQELAKVKAEFNHQLEALRDTNQDNERYLNIVLKYQALMKKAVKPREIKALMKDFQEEVQSTKMSDELRYKNYVKVSKIAMRSYFRRLCEIYIQNNPSDEERASTFLENLCFYINSVEPAKFQDFFKKLIEIKFENLDDDLKIYREFEPIFYINRRENDVLALLRKDEKNAYLYSLNKKVTVTVPLEIFERMFISLKTFFKKGEYVGDRTILLKDIDNIPHKVERPFQEFAWCYNKEIMLAIEEEHGVDSQRIVFYPITHYKDLFRRPYWSISVERDKSDVRSDIRSLEDSEEALIIIETILHDELLKPFIEDTSLKPDGNSK